MIVGLIAATMAAPGCSNSENAVTKDTSPVPNKRTSRIDKLKGTKPVAKKAGP